MTDRVYICVDCDMVYDVTPDDPCECGCCEFTTGSNAELFDADELGLNPEHDEERKYA